jgi:hypothetical protein
MSMKTTISGKKIIQEMKQVAKEYFAAHANPSCVCVGVKQIGGRESSGRAKDGGERTVYVGISGDTGRALLRDTLNAENVDGGGWTTGDVTAALGVMASGLAVYRSKKNATAAVVQAENWTTHNCAESNLALYLYKNGVRASAITIASYEINGTTISYKALCHNCQQWCRQHFSVLDDFDAHTR